MPNRIAAPTDRASGAVELGPRSLALLRRIALSLEILADQKVTDPGSNFEFDDNADGDNPNDS